MSKVVIDKKSVKGRRILKEIIIDGKVLKLTDDIKKKFLPSEAGRLRVESEITKKKHNKRRKMEYSDDLNKEALIRFIENQESVSNLFTGWNKKEDFKTWDDFMQWHKDHSGKGNG